jgi:hypothetical protein
VWPINQSIRSAVRVGLLAHEELRQFDNTYWSEGKLSAVSTKLATPELATEYCQLMDSIIERAEQVEQASTAQGE